MRIMQRIDDVDYAKDRNEVIAHHTVKLTWQVDGGKVRNAELDLSDKHLIDYGGPIEELLDAYEENQPQKVTEEAQPVRPAKGASLVEARRYGAAVNKFANEYGIKAMDGSGRPAYMAPGGSYYKPRWLKRSYEHWVKTGEVVLPRSAKEASEDFLAADIRAKPE